AVGVDDGAAGLRLGAGEVLSRHFDCSHEVVGGIRSRTCSAAGNPFSLRVPSVTSPCRRVSCALSELFYRGAKMAGVTTADVPFASAAARSGEPFVETPTAYDAILLASFGGPEGQDDVIPFLRNVTRGRGIPDERLELVSTHYRAF